MTVIRQTRDGQQFSEEGVGQFSERADWREELKDITASVLAEAEVEEQARKAQPEDADDVRASLERVATLAAGYYQALLDTGLPERLAAALLLEWHNLFWQQGLSNTR